MEIKSDPVGGVRIGELLGGAIAAKRKKLGWTQAYLAERLRVDAETVSRFERGVTLPSLQRLFEISETLEISTGELLVGCSQRAMDQAAMLAARMQSLKPGDRDFVVNQFMLACDYLEAREAR
ncbi:helix-turn-helix transcriptional regulator [Ferriphaselus sp. R-1]|uniref:helix-turn-helix domain-containing protein n=1 Tax=Ferriphaselus sp. R-1 TaxID=1485544 RepID=UPI00068EA51B|nr:helix-turn-helix transcriptional regulator [Ferriphaselus sp. R-1]